MRQIVMASALAFGVTLTSTASYADSITFVQTSDHSSTTAPVGNNTPGVQITVASTATVGTFLVTATLPTNWSFITNGQDQATIAFSLFGISAVNFTPVNPAAFGTGAGQWAPVGTGGAVDTSNPVNGTTSNPTRIGLNGNINVATGAFGYGLLFTPTSPGGSGGYVPSVSGDLQFNLSSATATALTLASFVQGGFSCSGQDCSNANPIAGFFFADVRNPANGNTGVIDYGPSAVPLPGAAWLFGTALVGMGILGRRRKKSLAA